MLIDVLYHFLCNIIIDSIEIAKYAIEITIEIAKDAIALKQIDSVSYYSLENKTKRVR